MGSNGYFCKNFKILDIFENAPFCKFPAKNVQNGHFCKYFLKSWTFLQIQYNLS